MFYNRLDRKESKSERQRERTYVCVSVLQGGLTCNNSNYKAGFPNKTTSSCHISHYCFLLSSSTGTDGLSVSKLHDSAKDSCL